MPPPTSLDEIIEISDDSTEDELNTTHDGRRTPLRHYNCPIRIATPMSAPVHNLTSDESMDDDSTSDYYNSGQNDVSFSGREGSGDFDDSSDSDDKEEEELDDASTITVRLDIKEAEFTTTDRLPSTKITRKEFQHHLRLVEGADDLQLLYPPSLWRENSMGIIEDEHKFLQAHRTSTSSFAEEQWNEITLTDFCAYNDLTHKSHPGKYESLHTIASEQASRDYLLDGVARYNNSETGIVLQGAKISKVSIGGLELSSPSCEQQIWIQTRHSEATDTWYKLTTPAADYNRIWEDFCWLANFAKYCIDYLNLAEDIDHQVTLEDFRIDFIDQMTNIHGRHFQEWQSLIISQGKDMRRHIVQFGSFVYDQFYNITSSENWINHPLWDEIGLITIQTLQASTKIEKTLVTRNVAETFLPSFPQWSSSKDGYDLLQQADCFEEVESLRQIRLQCLNICNKFELDQSDNFRIEDGTRVSRVQWTRREAAYNNHCVEYKPDDLVEKLVLVWRQGHKHKHKHKHKTHQNFTFALVKSVTNDRRHIRVIWLIAPMETICGNAKGTDNQSQAKPQAHYPIGDELFYSDKCNCYSVKISDIVGTYSISTTVEAHKRDKTEFFVVAKYCEKEQCFTKPSSIPQNTCRTLCSTLGTKQSSGHQLNSELNVESTDTQCLQHDKLANVSLFSGCGLFDRALEVSGALSTVLSIDYDPLAVRSAKANYNRSGEPRPEKCPEFVVSSVNTELRKIMGGERVFPEAGCLSAGCPCPGFSAINYRKMSEKGQRDCTLLAATMSWIEILLPAYVVIENVVGMNSNSKSGSPSACCQAVSFLVALGYQVRKIRLKAPDFGGCTLRERLFILAAAPAYRLPCIPIPSHVNENGHGLKPTVSAREAISDLDPVHNDTLMTVSMPYHVPLARLVSNVTKNGANIRDILRRIPISPPGQGIVNSRKLLNVAQRAWFNSLHNSKKLPHSRTMRRVHPDKFFPTVVTSAQWTCCYTGQIIHYDQHRVLSLEEVARAQGVPRDFILVGTTAQKLRQIGNAVPWCFREAIGNSIKRAYHASKRAESDITLESIGAGVQDNDSDSDSDVVFSTKVQFEYARAQHENSISSRVEKHVSHIPVETMKSKMFRKRLRSCDFSDEDNKETVRVKKIKEYNTDTIEIPMDRFTDDSDSDSDNDSHIDNDGESYSDTEDESDENGEEEDNGNEETQTSDINDSDSGNNLTDSNDDLL